MVRAICQIGDNGNEASEYVLNANVKWHGIIYIGLAAQSSHYLECILLLHPTTRRWHEVQMDLRNF
jgi:hypothetical protein